MVEIAEARPDQPLLAADGTPLKRKLEQAMRLSRMRALGLVAPLLAYILVVFIIPIIYFMIQGVYNPIYEENMPRSAALLQEWDGRSPVTEEMAAAMVADLAEAREKKTIGRVATRVNQEWPGTRSLFTSTARKAKRMKPPYLEALLKADREWGDIEVWRAIKVAATSWTPAYYLAALDFQYRGDGTIVQQSEDRRIYRQLFLRTFEISLIVTVATLVLGFPVAWLLANVKLRTANLLMIMVLLPFWTSILVRTTAWIAMLQGQGVLNDLMAFTGINQVILQFLLLFNDYDSLQLQSLCANDVNAVLANPAATLKALAAQAAADSTRCGAELVRVYLESGIDAAVARAEELREMAMRWGYGDERFSMIYNKTGTIVAMTHILLPFMILPLYSVMKTIPPSYVRAAKSLGATDWTAFWRVYFPQTIPGIGAGVLLVFILAIGYYITPALVGGQDGQMISNMIDFHMRKSLNWSLAAALGGVLLVIVLFLYWLYDRIVGVEKLKLG